MKKDVALTPETLSSALRKIADRLDNSQSPSLTLVAAEISRLALRIREARTPMPGRITKVRPAINTATDVSNDAEYDRQMKRYASKK